MLQIEAPPPEHEDGATLGAADDKIDTSSRHRGASSTSSSELKLGLPVDAVLSVVGDVQLLGHDDKDLPDGCGAKSVPLSVSTRTLSRGVSARCSAPLQQL